MSNYLSHVTANIFFTPHLLMYRLIVFIFLIYTYNAQTATPRPSPSIFQASGNENPPASVIIDFQNNKKSSTGALDLEASIVEIMGISDSLILIVHYSIESATVLICDGDVEDFVNDVNQSNSNVEGTQLENALVRLVIWNVPCTAPDFDDSSEILTGSYNPQSSPESSDAGRDQVRTSFTFSSASTLDFPTQNLPSSQIESVSSTSVMVVSVLTVLMGIFAL